MLHEGAQKVAPLPSVSPFAKRWIGNPKSDVIGHVVLRLKNIRPASDAERQQTNEEPKRAYAGHHG
jgi:hypothetical protein